MDKIKKKTLTISSGLKKKINTTSIKTSGKQSFSVEKKKPFRQNKSFTKPNLSQNSSPYNNPKRKFYKKSLLSTSNKRFIKKDNKPVEKSVKA